MIRTAVIPAAGAGTRMFPATRIVKKELLPVVAPDGIARPALLEIIREALSIGVERLVLVVRPADLATFQSLFNQPLPPEHYAKLPPDLQREADHLLEIGPHIEYAIQPLQEGFGHAVWCARDLVSDEPFLLLLGDHLYRSHQKQSCAAQLAEAHDRFGSSVVALTTTTSDDLPNRGVVGGSWREPSRVLHITAFSEKPSLADAQQHLRVPSLPPDHYLILFGQYILDPAIFTYLDDLIRRDQRHRGEYQFTTALETLRRDHGCLGLLVDGDTYDIGQPHLYVETLEAYRRPPTLIQ